MVLGKEVYRGKASSGSNFDENKSYKYFNSVFKAVNPSKFV